MVRQRLRVVYFVVANTAILVWTLQIGACVFLSAYDRFVPTLLRPPIPEAVARNHAHMSREDRDDLLATTRSLRFRYEPILGFMEQAITSRFVNIDAHSIRANGPTPRDVSALQDATWFFGGSTAFGYGVADAETIPAQLERALGRPVLNLGVRDYSSTEENLLLNHYLRIGYRPALAIFLDGINETCNQDFNRATMDSLVDRIQNQNAWDIGGPVMSAQGRLSRKIRKLRGLEPDRQDRLDLACVQDGKQFPLATIHRHRLAEREALCRLYQIECRTFVQPFAGTHGRRDGLERKFLDGAGADLGKLFLHLEPGWRAAGAVFVTDALAGYDRHPFVDDIHYSADASRVIAEAMAGHIRGH